MAQAPAADDSRRVALQLHLFDHSWRTLNHEAGWVASGVERCIDAATREELEEMEQILHELQYEGGEPPPRSTSVALASTATRLGTAALVASAKASLYAISVAGRATAVVGSYAVIAAGKGLQGVGSLAARSGSAFLEYSSSGSLHDPFPEEGQEGGRNGPDQRPRAAEGAAGADAAALAPAPNAAPENEGSDAEHASEVGQEPGHPPEREPEAPGTAAMESQPFLVRNRAVDLLGRTRLHEAASQGQPGLVVFLIAHGWHVDAPSLVCETPLFDALLGSYGEDAAHVAGQRAVVRLLLAFGADPLYRNAEGQCPLDVAVSEALASPSRADAELLLRLSLTCAPALSRLVSPAPVAARSGTGMDAAAAGSEWGPLLAASPREKPQRVAGLATVSAASTLLPRAAQAQAPRFLAALLPVAHTGWRSARPLPTAGVVYGPLPAVRDVLCAAPRAGLHLLLVGAATRHGGGSEAQGGRRRLRARWPVLRALGIAPPPDAEAQGAVEEGDGHGQQQPVDDEVGGSPCPLLVLPGPVSAHASRVSVHVGATPASVASAALAALREALAGGPPGVRLLPAHCDVTALRSALTALGDSEEEDEVDEDEGDGQEEDEDEDGDDRSATTAVPGIVAWLARPGKAAVLGPQAAPGGLHVPLTACAPLADDAPPVPASHTVHVPAGRDVTLVVSLRDAWGNPVPHEPALLPSLTVALDDSSSGGRGGSGGRARSASSPPPHNDSAAFVFDAQRTGSPARAVYSRHDAAAGPTRGEAGRGAGEAGGERRERGAAARAAGVTAASGPLACSLEVAPVYEAASALCARSDEAQTAGDGPAREEKEGVAEEDEAGRAHAAFPAATDSVAAAARSWLRDRCTPSVRVMNCGATPGTGAEVGLARRRGLHAVADAGPLLRSHQAAQCVLAALGGGGAAPPPSPHPHEPCIALLGAAGGEGGGAPSQPLGPLLKDGLALGFASRVCSALSRPLPLSRSEGDPPEAATASRLPSAWWRSRPPTDAGEQDAPLPQSAHRAWGMARHGAGRAGVRVAGNSLADALRTASAVNGWCRGSALQAAQEALSLHAVCVRFPEPGEYEVRLAVGSQAVCGGAIRVAATTPAEAPPSPPGPQRSVPEPGLALAGQGAGDSGSSEAGSAQTGAAGAAPSVAAPAVGPRYSRAVEDQLRRLHEALSPRVADAGGAAQPHSDRTASVSATAEVDYGVVAVRPQTTQPLGPRPGGGQ